MIVRITGNLAGLEGESVLVERDGVIHEIFVPAFSLDFFQSRIGQTVTIHTIEYYEGSAVGGNLFPRLIGFPEREERQFFVDFTKVKGIGYRKALRALSQPIRDVATAIEDGNVKFLSTLPEIGKRTAEQMIATLRGKLAHFTWPDDKKTPHAQSEELKEYQRESLEILLQLGEKRADAVELIHKICQENPKIVDPASVVELVYRRKSGVI
jgi:Holliday junction DNA helicase RuvA